MTLALYGKSRKRRGALLLTAFLAVLAATLGGLALIGTAFAHNATITPSNACLNADGSWQVKWTITNDYNLVATISNPLVTVQSGSGVPGSTTPSLAGMTIPATNSTSSVSATSQAIPSTVTGVQLQADVFWSDGYGDGHYSTYWAQTPKPALNPYTSSTVNKPTTPCTPPKIILSDSTCTSPGLASFHFLSNDINEPDKIADDGGSLSGTYKVDNGAPQTFGPIAEYSDSNVNADWRFSIAVPAGGSSITVLTATSGTPGFGVWPSTGAGHEVATVLDCAPGTVKVHIAKYLDKAPATDTSANSTSFPMTATWTTTNFPSGTGSYTLGPSGFGGAPAYQADTSAMNTGASYTTSETGILAQCSTDPAPFTPYRLVGYSTGSSFANAATATVSTTPPALTNIQSDQYVIVWNDSCAKVPTITVTKTDDATNHQVNASGTFNWTITLTVANGPTASAYSFTDAAPAGMTFSTSPTVTGSGLTCGTHTATQVACTLASGAATGTYTVKIPTTAPALSEVANVCKAYENDVFHTTEVAGPVQVASDTVTVVNCPQTITRTINVCKVIDNNNDGINDGGAFTFTVADGTSTQNVSITTHESPIPASDTANGCVAVTNVAVGHSVTVTETATRPAGWTDVTGYPKYLVSGGALTSGSVATIASGTTAQTVTFHNETDPTPQQVTFIKYICPDKAAVPDTSATPVTPDPGTGGCVLAPTGWTFNLSDNASGASLGTVTTASDGSGSTTITLTSAQLSAALGAGILVKEATPPTGFTEIALRCYNDNFQGGYDNQELIKLSQSGTAGVYCLAYNVAPAQHITLEKVICTDYQYVPANDNELNANDTGGYGDFVGTSYGIGAVRPVALNNYDTAHCAPANGWQFQLMDVNGTAVGAPTAATGSGSNAAGLVDVTLSSAQQALISSSNGLWVKEITQTSARFGGLRCYQDVLNGDNLEVIRNVAAGTAGINCIAYNVALPNVTINKTADSKSVNAGQNIGFTVTVTNNGGTQTNIPVTDSLPSVVGYTWSLDSQTGTACALSSNVVSCTIPSLTLGQSYTFHVKGTASLGNITAKTCGDVTNTAYIGTKVPGVDALVAEGTWSTATTTIANCTGTVVIQKVVEPGSSTNPSDTTPQFSGTFDSGTWGNLGDGQSQTISNVLLGSHTITENAGTVGQPGDNLWQNVGFFAPISQGDGFICPTSPAGATALTPSAIVVTGGQTTTICVLNKRNQPDTIGASVTVFKVVTGNNPSSIQQFNVSVTPSNTAVNTQNITNGTGFVTPISLTTDVPNATFSVTENSVPSGYQLLGYKLIVGGSQTCPAATGLSSAVTNQAIGTASNLAYTVCVYNQPNGTINVHKTTETNGIIDTNNGGWKFTVSSVACGITNVALTTDASGNASASVPACSDYVVTENTATPPVANYTVVGSATQTGIVVPAGGIGTANFLNVRTVNSGCTNPAGCTPPPPSCTVTNTCTPPLTITTPTPTATPTTVAPTATPTKSVEKPANTPTATPSNTTNVLGEKTPGPGSTPVAPSTGSGFFGGTGGGFNAFIAALGLLALTAGFAILGVARKERRG